ncbi:AbrB family transcriptional regulator, partial [Staphylococcus lugdunensis]|uniref:AbrB family transcriptional regulator n=1 Tax=Staphylococcus lugdunensis TaxID=28035 RepID=UPI0030BCC91B
NTETAILSVIPGALSQRLVMAEEDKNANILVVSLTQTSRIIFVVILVTLISYFFQNNQSSGETIVKAKPLTHVLNIWQFIFIVLA